MAQVSDKIEIGEDVGVFISQKIVNWPHDMLKCQF
jgi:hypothetical protein